MIQNIESMFATIAFTKGSGKNKNNKKNAKNATKLFRELEAKKKFSLQQKNFTN